MVATSALCRLCFIFLSLTIFIYPVTASAATVEPATAISIWTGFNDEEFAILEAITTDFEASHPTIAVNLERHAANTLYQDYVHAAEVGGGPTILMDTADWTDRLFQAGLIQELTRYTSPDLLEILFPAALALGEVQGKLLSLPRSIRGTLLYRNSSLAPIAPTTFAELISAAQASPQGASLERGFFYSSPHLFGVGGEMMDQHGCPAFVTPQGVAWLELLHSFTDAGLAVNYSDDDLNSFLAGENSFLIDGSWNFEAILAALGAADLAIDPWPAPMRGWIQADSLYLNSNASPEESDAAWEFMEMLVAPPAQAAMLAVDHIPVLKSVAISDPLLLQIQTLLVDHLPFYAPPQIDYYWGPMDIALTSVFDQAVDPLAALENAAQTIRTGLAAAGYACNYIYLPLGAYNFSGTNP